MSEIDAVAGDRVVVVLRPQGRLIGEDAQRVKEAVREELTAGRDVILDVSDIRLMDSEGLGALVVAHKVACTEGRRMVLCCLGHNIRALLELTRLHRVFEIEEDVASARTAVGAHR